MSTTYYITTANYGTRVAELANATANYANVTVNSLTYLASLLPQVDNIDAALANAAAANTLSQTANAVAFIANNTAFLANSVANQANATANNANSTVTFLYPIVIGMQGNVSALQSNVANLQANVWRIEPNVWRIEANLVAFEQLGGNVVNLESNVRNLQTNVSALQVNVSALQINVSALQSNVANLQPNVWRIESNVVKFEQLSGNVANLESNVNMLWSNVNRLWINVNTTNVVANLASIVANQANVTANYANSVLTQYYANLINLPNLYAFASNANLVAQLANTVANQANVTANAVNVWITTNYDKINTMNSVFQQISLNGLALWSNGIGNIYTYSNVGIGTMSTNDGNVLTVLGNVFISGNLRVVGGLTTQTVPTGTVYQLETPYTVQSPNVRNEFILNLLRFTPYGSLYTLDSNSIKFSQIGLYTAGFNIQATASDGEYDSIVSVNVYTNTSNTLTGASLFTSFSNPATFGPQMQPINVPLYISNTSNNYIITCSMYRNTYPYTIVTKSFLQIGMMSQLGIPVAPTVPTIITQKIAEGFVGINKQLPTKTLDVGGDTNIDGGLYLSGNPTWTAFQDYMVYTGNIALGGYPSPTSGNTLSISGNVNTTGYIFSNVYYSTGLPFNYGTDNVFSTQNVLVQRNLTVLGNIIGGPWSYTDSVNLYTNYSNVVVNGNIRATQYILGDISLAQGTPANQNWGLYGTNVYPSNDRNVCIGTANALTGNILTVNGNISANYIYANISTATGLYTPWSQGINNTYIVSNIGIGTSLVGNTLDVNGNVYLNGNVYITGKLSAEQVFMIACSDESSIIIPKSNAVTFRSPGKWYLTKVPRISLRTPPVAGANVNVFVNINTTIAMLTSNLCIQSSNISSRTQTGVDLSQRILNPDDLVNINITYGDTATNGATGLKIAFYYMDIQ